MSGMSEVQVGSTVQYVCGASHNTPNHVCEPGDVHAAIVAEILNRDPRGEPILCELAVFVPGQPSVFWVRAARARRSPGMGGQVLRVVRGAPPLESAGRPTEAGQVTYLLDFPVGSFHVIGE